MSYAHTLDDYEARNAQLWDTETILSEQTENDTEVKAVASGAQTLGGSQYEQRTPVTPDQRSTPHASSGYQHPLAEIDRAGITNLPSVQAPHSHASSLPLAAQHHSFRGRNRVHDSPSRSSQAPPRITRPESRYNSQCGFPQAGQSGQARTQWGTKIPLCTTRHQKQIHEKAAKTTDNAVYMEVPDSSIHFQVTGYYLWPTRYENPYDLLGENLNSIQRLRPHLRVNIHWNGEKRNFQITSSSSRSGQQNVCEAILAIRRIVQSAKALAASAPPLRLVEPPGVQTIRRFIQPVFPPDIGGPNALIVPSRAVIGFVLNGPKLLLEERSAWGSKRETLQKSQVDGLRSYLIQYLHNLSPVQDRMRFRLHFGNLQLPECPAHFTESRFGFDEFCGMLRPNLLKTTFDKQIDNAGIALELRNRIADHPAKYCPADPMIANLQEVPARHTMVIFARKEGGPEYRIEADIDLVSNSRASRYQFGATRYYLNNQRNKHLEVINVDVDKGVDWILEVITDKSLSSVPEELPQFIENCLTAETVEREDRLGLKFPGMKPRWPLAIKVSSVAIRSAFQFLNKESNFVVDVSIYRDWHGVDIAREPKLMTSVSMFHRQWENAMEGINSTATRSWDSELKTFFPDHDGKDGLQIFLNDSQWIQQQLSSIAKDFKANYVQPQVSSESPSRMRS